MIFHAFTTMIWLVQQNELRSLEDQIVCQKFVCYDDVIVKKKIRNNATPE